MQSATFELLVWRKDFLECPLTRIRGLARMI